MDERFDDASALVAELTRLLESEEPVEATLQHIAGLMQGAVTHCDACGVTVFREGSPVVVAATDDRVGRLETAQHTNQEGPSLDAIREDEPVRFTAGDERWPRFAAVAEEAGIRNVLSVPLKDGATEPAVLSLYSSHEEAFTGATYEVTLMFARHATVALHNARVYERCMVLVGQLNEAMASRAVIEQAKGVLIEREHCSPDEAFGLLREASQRTNAKLRDVARAIVHTASNGRMDEG